MKRIVVNTQLKEAIGNRKVTAALFNTFNFDPLFFENYVMPVLMPSDKSFGEEAAHNSIIWRYCAKENQIPPITVYCDYYAKNDTQSPSLGYDIFCIKVPNAPGNICNFHPKHIILLFEDDNTNQSLLLITGSGNITVSGWCDNFECFSFIEIKKNKTQPNKTTTNQLQDYINQVNSLGKQKRFTKAENDIYNFLSYVDLNINYFNSFEQSFKDFLSENIFDKEIINEVEIISPYFSKNTDTIDFLKSKNVKDIKCLIPFLRNNEIQLEKTLFTTFQDAGLSWCFWADKESNKEVRNQHAKIYRFYGTNKCYTIIGSVNFTNPAWTIYSARNNKANIESAILYKENLNQEKLLKKVANLNIDQFTFIVKDEEQENPDATAFKKRNAPEIEFVIDWKLKLLSIKSELADIKCQFHNILDNQALINGKAEIQLTTEYLKQLGDNPLIQVMVVENESTSIYTYYATQLNFETKPLGFKINTETILKYWHFFDDEYKKNRLTKKIAEEITNESGIIEEGKLKTTSLLNDMAAHFSGLVKLENHLFNTPLKNQKEIKNHFYIIKYYLLNENIDTLTFFIKDLKEKHENGKIQNSFYWMMLQIITNVILAKAEKWEHRSTIKYLELNEWSNFKKDIKQKRTEFNTELSEISKLIPDLKLKETWVLEQLMADYE